MTAIAGVEMDSMVLFSFLHLGGGVMPDPRDIKWTHPSTPKQAALKISMLLGGYVAELNRPTPEDLLNQNYFVDLQFKAYIDFEKATKVLKQVIHKGWLTMDPKEIPNLNTKRFIKVSKSLQAAQTLPPDQKNLVIPKITENYEKEVAELEKFLRLPVIQQSLADTCAIHRILSSEKREALIEAAIQKEMYEKDALYALLDKHVSDEDGKKMTRLADTFAAQLFSKGDAARQ